MTATYIISKLIVNTGKAHTIGEKLILPTVKEVLKTVLQHATASSVIKNAPLNNRTVRRWTDVMAEDIEASVCKILMSSKYSPQIDESTLLRNESLLLAYVRFLKEGEIIQEKLFTRSLIADTKG